MSLFCTAIKEIQFLPSYPCPGHLMCNFPRLSLELSIQFFFFPFLPSRFYCVIVCPYIDITVIGCSNSSFFTFLVHSPSSWIVESTQSSVLASPLSPSFLDTEFFNTLPCTSLLISLYFYSFIWFFCSFVWFIPLFILRVVPSILENWLPTCLFHGRHFCSWAWFREVFSFFWGTLFFSFLFFFFFFSFFPFFISACLKLSISNIFKHLQFSWCSFAFLIW